MADLSKSGITSGQTIDPGHITNLYDALTGDTVFDNIKINNVKCYKAVLTQVSTNAPTATVLHNTLSDTPVWGRTNSGVYTCTLASEFPNNKVFVLITNSYNGGECETLTIAAERTNDNVISVYCVLTSDGTLSDLDIGGDESAGLVFIQIEVYP